MSICVYDTCGRCKHFVNDDSEILLLNTAYELSDIYTENTKVIGYCRAWGDVIILCGGRWLPDFKCQYFEPEED